MDRTRRVLKHSSFLQVYWSVSKLQTIEPLICEGRCLKYAACVDLMRGDVCALCIPPTAERARSSGAAQMLSWTQKEGNVLQRNLPPGQEFGKTSLVLLNMCSDTQHVHNVDIFSRTALQLCQIETFRVGETFPKRSERSRNFVITPEYKQMTSFICCRWIIYYNPNG